MSKNKKNIFGKLNSDIDLLIINYGFYKRNDYVYIEKHFKQISKKLKTSILYLNDKKSFLFDNGHKIAQLEFHNLEIFHIKDYDIILQDNLYSINLLSKVRRGKAIICITPEFFDKNEISEQFILPNKSLIVSKKYSIYVDKNEKIIKNNENIVEYNIL